MTDPSELWKQIVRYSAVANGTALTLALSSIGKTPVVQLSATIGKFPIWCFFLGLVASGLHLVCSFVYALESKGVEANKKVQSLSDKLEGSLADAIAQGELSARTAEVRRELQSLKDQLSELDLGQTPGFLGGMRNAQEGLLWAAYGFFVIGLAAVVWAT